MTTNEVKNWLNRARRVSEEVNTLYRGKLEEEARCMSITSRPDAIRAGGTKDPHTYDKLAELSEAVDIAMINALTEKQEILHVIGKVDDQRYRIILFGRYIRGLTLESLATEMHYSYMQVCRLHGNALMSVKAILELML